MSFVGQFGRQGQATTYSGPLPTVANNDVVFLFWTHTNTQTLAATNGITINGVDVTTSRFTQRDSIVENALVVDIFTATLQAADSGLTLALTQSGSSKSTLSVLVHRGIDTTTPILVSANEHDTTAARTTPQITLTTAADVISHMAERISSGANTGSTVPTGLTKANDLYNAATGQNDSSTGYAVAVPAGTAGAYSWTVNGGAVTARRIGYTAALRPAGYNPTPTRTVRAGKGDGTEATVTSIVVGNGDGTSSTVSSFTTS